MHRPITAMGSRRAMSARTPGRVNRSCHSPQGAGRWRTRSTRYVPVRRLRGGYDRPLKLGHTAIAPGTPGAVLLGLVANGGVGISLPPPHELFKIIA
jgi:hypothetical protein